MLTGMRADRLLLIASMGCLGGLLILALFSLPVLALAVVPPAVQLHWRGVQLARIRRAATTDAATGLLNAYGWHQRADAMAVPAGVGVLVIDLDRFKSINDSHGHLVGDRVLAAVAAAVANSVRSKDATGRLGGDEFAVFLPDITTTELARVAERVRSTIAELRVDTGDGSITGMSVSIGAAICANGCVTTIEQLLSAADQALYTAKRRGRNVVSLASTIAPIRVTRGG